MAYPTILRYHARAAVPPHFLINFYALDASVGRGIPVISGTTWRRASVWMTYVVWDWMSLRRQPRRQTGSNDIGGKAVGRGRRPAVDG